ncbi:maestro heat-like repeat-containing protein family member 1 [Ambystoma mexicanum]|uniref:maestro heat-like repeat-containing protein family member 1 n=1 Tax=Ambystoma mexicanum TaxID=8296 RepID=UPI0037E8447B
MPWWSFHWCCCGKKKKKHAAPRTPKNPVATSSPPSAAVASVITSQSQDRKCSSTGSLVPVSDLVTPTSTPHSTTTDTPVTNLPTRSCSSPSSPRIISDSEPTTARPLSATTSSTVRISDTRHCRITGTPCIVLRGSKSTTSSKAQGIAPDVTLKDDPIRRNSLQVPPLYLKGSKPTTSSKAQGIAPDVTDVRLKDHPIKRSSLQVTPYVKGSKPTTSSKAQGIAPNVPDVLLKDHPLRRNSLQVPPPYLKGSKPTTSSKAQGIAPNVPDVLLKDHPLRRNSLQVPPPYLKATCYKLLDALGRFPNPRSVTGRIHTFALQDFDAVASAIQTYLTRQTQISPRHRLSVYKALHTIVTGKNAFLSEERAFSIISTAFNDMKNPASGDMYQKTIPKILIFLEKGFSDIVNTLLLSSFQPGSLPHNNVFQTIADLSPSNGDTRVHFHYMVLGELMATIRLASEDTTKSAICQVIIKCSTTMHTYLSKSRSSEERSAAASTLNEAFVVIFYFWLENKESVAKKIMLKTVCAISHLLHWGIFEQHAISVIEELLRLYDTAIQPFYVTECIDQLLPLMMSSKSPSLKYKSHALVVKLVFQVCLRVDTDEASLGNQNKLLVHQNLISMANHCLEIVVGVLCAKAECGDKHECTTAVNILSDIICRCDGEEVKQLQHNILDTTMIVLNRQIREVTEGPMGDLICAMAYHRFIDSDQGWIITEYLVRHCVSSRPSSPCMTNEENVSTLQEKCLICLGFMCSHCPEISHILWEQLLGYVCTPAYSSVLFPVCLGLRDLTIRKQKEGMSKFVMDIRATKYLPSPAVMFTRLLVISCSLENEGKLAFAALRLLCSLSPLIIHQAMMPAWEKEISVMIHKLTEPRHLENDEWEDTLLEFIKRTSTKMKARSWARKVKNELEKQRWESTQQQKDFIDKVLRVMAHPAEGIT